MFKQIAISLSFIMMLACGGTGTSDPTTTPIPTAAPDPTPVPLPTPSTPPVANSINFNIHYKLDPSCTIVYPSDPVMHSSGSISSIHNLPQSYISANPEIKQDFPWDCTLLNSDKINIVVNIPTVQYVVLENTGAVDLQVVNFYSSNFRYALSAGYTAPSTVIIKSGELCDLAVVDCLTGTSHKFAGTFMVTIHPLTPNGVWDSKFTDLTNTSGDKFSLITDTTGNLSLSVTFGN